MSADKTWMGFGLAFVAGASVGAAVVAAVRPALGSTSTPILPSRPPMPARELITVFPLDAKGHLYTFDEIPGAYVDDRYRIRLVEELGGARWIRSAGDGPAVYEHDLGGGRWLVLKENTSFVAPHQIGRIYYVDRYSWEVLRTIDARMVERQLVVHMVLGAVES